MVHVVNVNKKKSKKKKGECPLEGVEIVTQQIVNFVYFFGKSVNFILLSS